MDDQVLRDELIVAGNVVSRRRDRLLTDFHCGSSETMTLFKEGRGGMWIPDLPDHEPPAVASVCLINQLETAGKAKATQVASRGGQSP